MMAPPSIQLGGSHLQKVNNGKIQHRNRNGNTIQSSTPLSRMIVIQAL